MCGHEVRLDLETCGPRDHTKARRSMDGGFCEPSRAIDSHKIQVDLWNLYNPPDMVQSGQGACKFVDRYENMPHSISQD
jgi:hypothetical protein